MALGDLDEDERDAIGVDDMHLVQRPRLLTCLAGDDHTALAQLLLDGVDIADLQPQRSREAAGGVVRPAVTGQFDQ